MPFKLFLFTLALLSTRTAFADASNCFGLNEGCVEKSRSYVSGSSSGQVKMNPSSVPIDDGLGIEGLFYGSSVDLMLVRGNGRIGAAISPANSESTFFGPPAIEIPESFLKRNIEHKKYESQKFTLATAFSLYDNKASDLKRFGLRLGAMGKYNAETGAILPGGGLTTILGPLNLTYSYYKDETMLHYQEVLGPTAGPPVTFHYHVQTYGVGLYLSSLILDYSHLQMRDDENASAPSEIDLYTAGLVLRKAIFTVGVRKEKSAALAYNYETKMLETKELKSETFLGAQYKVHKHVMLGVFYNYYLLHELSAAVTLFW